MATLTLLILSVFSSLAMGQQTTGRLDVVYSGATAGRIRGFEQGNPKSNYIDLIWPSSLAANYTQTMPKSTGTLLSTINYHYHDSQALSWSAWRAHGTEAAPTDLVGGDDIVQITGLGRAGGTWASFAAMSMNVATIGPDTGQLDFWTRNASGILRRIAITSDGHLFAHQTGQTIGTSSGYFASAYLKGTAPIFFDRSTRSTNQSTVWSIAGTTTGTGTWTLGMQPNVSESSFHITHAGNNRLILLENGQLDLSGPAVNATSANASFSIVNAVGSPAYRVNGTTVIDASRNASFVNLTLTGTCTGCPAGTPPVDWWLDSGGDVVTLGNHGTVSAAQLLTKFSRGTHASPSDAADTDQIFGLKMQYYAGGAYRDAAAIFGYAAGTPSGSSSPGKLSFFVTPAGATAGVERFYIDETESWFSSSLTGNWLLNIKNTSSSGYSGIGFFSHDNTHSGYVGWNNSASSVNPSTFTVGTRSNDLLVLITQDTPRWLLSGTGFVPSTDGQQAIGNISAKPSEVYSRVFKTYTASGIGTQTSEFVADANLNLHLVSFSSAAATDRGSFQMHRYRGSLASPSAVVNGDRLGNIAWQGYTSGGLVPGAAIESYVSDTVSSGVLPAELRLKTTNPAGTFADRWIIEDDGDLIPKDDDTYFIGIGGQRPAAVVTMDHYVYRDFILPTGRVASHFLPKTDATHNLGSSSLKFNHIYGNFTHGGDIDGTTVTATTAMYVIVSSVTRFSASGGGILVYNSGGTNTFSVSSTGGNTITNGYVDAAGGFKYGGTSGITANIAYLKDLTTTCTAVYEGGIRTGTTGAGCP